MATSSSYATRNDLQKVTQSTLSLLSQRDTLINKNKNDISALQLAIKDLDTGIHYVGDVTALPTTAVDGALYQVVGSTTTAVVDGWYFYSVDSTAWKQFGGTGSGVTTADITTTNINFSTEIDQ